MTQKQFTQLKTMKSISLKEKYSCIMNVNIENVDQRRRIYQKCKEYALLSQRKDLKNYQDTFNEVENEKMKVTIPSAEK